MAGLCEITYRDIYTVCGLQEMQGALIWGSLLHWRQHQCNSTNNQLDRQHGQRAEPCFMSIPPCSLEAWNLHRLNTGRTTHLIHHRHYPDNLIFVINEINKFIVSTNSRNGMATPFLANTIIQSCGPSKNYRVHYDRLSRWDACHHKHQREMGQDDHQSHHHQQKKEAIKPVSNR